MCSSDLAEMLSELFSSDAEAEKATSNLLRNPNMAEWPGAGAFFEALKHAIYERGMCKHNGRWVPSPENGPQFDIVEPDGSRHWVDGAYFVYPQTPWRDDIEPDGDQEELDLYSELREKLAQQFAQRRESGQ